jgi:hypothetical protein
MTILEGIKEISVDMWIRRSEIRERFKDELRKIFRSNVDTEVAIAWIIALSMYDFPREDVWVSIAETRASAIKAFFFELEIEGYLLKHFFNEAQDINQLMQLLEVVDDDLKPKVLDVLAETESQDAMNALAKYNYKTPGWKALYVINGLASVSEWTVNLIKFLDDIEKLADLNSNQAKALVLICRLHARQITLEELVQRFPKNGVSATWRRGYDVRNELNRLKAVVPTPLKRKITVLIDALTDEDAY